MKQIIIFSGTTEGRLLSQALGRRGIPVLACVATEYGGQLAGKAPGAEAGPHVWGEPVEEASSGQKFKDEAGGAVCFGGWRALEGALRRGLEGGTSGKPRQGSCLDIHVGRMTREEMEGLFQREQPSLVVDATHPYAALVSENICAACQDTGTEYLRLIRPRESAGEEDCVIVQDVEEAVEYLRHTKGNVLLTTGSKELKAFTALPDYRERLYARVLSTPEVAASCSRLGFVGAHLICMQGPFSRELNTAMLRQVKARFLVTKESGKTGGFPEKLAAAREAGARVVLIGRPKEQPGKTPEEVCRILEKHFGLRERLDISEEADRTEGAGETARIETVGETVRIEAVGETVRIEASGETARTEASGKAVCTEAGGGSSTRHIILAGIGMGTPENMTREVWDACCQADCIIGARRMLQSVEALGKPVFSAYQPDEICHFIDTHPEYGKIVLVLSGDVGFYSGAKKLLETLKKPGVRVTLLPGISSVVYFCSRLQTSWEDVKLCSVHGRDGNLVAAVREHPKVFTLLGGTDGVRSLCRELLEYGMGRVNITVGERLHYEMERIVKGTPEELAEEAFDGLCVALLENPDAFSGIPACLEDELFLRGKAPMTKSEVRSVSVAKLRLTRDAVVYDVGAGTGSVTIEMALQASQGTVYAVEKKAEAADLIEENKRRFGTPNIQVVRGLAPGALQELPAPTHVFIGGSSGNLKEILEVILRKNPKARIVMNAITLETVGEMNDCLKELPLKNREIVQLTVARAKALGGYQMMMGQNPVYIVSCTGGE